MNEPVRVTGSEAIAAAQTGSWIQRDFWNPTRRSWWFAIQSMPDEPSVRRWALIDILASWDVRIDFHPERVRGNPPGDVQAGEKESDWVVMPGREEALDFTLRMRNGGVA